MRRRAIRKAALDLAKKGKDLVSQAALKFRDSERKRIEREAREKAEAERQALIKQQEKEARALEARAKRTKNAEKKAALVEAAAAVKADEVESVDSVVGEILRDVESDWKGAGKGTEVEHWKAEVVDPVALFKAAIEDPPKFAKFVGVNTVELGREARRLKREDLGIPGVRGVSEKGLART